MQRLIKIENEKEVWYFTSQLKAANFIGCTPMHISNILHGIGKTAKGWSIEIVEDDYIMSKFIDPEPNVHTAEELVLTKQLFELLRQVIENDKRINELERKIEGLTNDLNQDYINIIN